MINHEDKIIYDVLKRFDGMHKIDICDVLHKIEMLLTDLTTPIDYGNLKKELLFKYAKEHITAIDKNGYCYLEDHCQFMKVYRIKSVFPILFVRQELFFTTPQEYRLIPYTATHIRSTFCNTPVYPMIADFLQQHSITKRNPKTKRLLLIELFNQIDPYYM